MVGMLLRARGMDVTTARDQAMLQQDDQAQLEHAVSLERCVFTHNRLHAAWPGASTTWRPVRSKTNASTFDRQPCLVNPGFLLSPARGRRPGPRGHLGLAAKLLDGVEHVLVAHLRVDQPLILAVGHREGVRPVAVGLAVVGGLRVQRDDVPAGADGAGLKRVNERGVVVSRATVPDAHRSCVRPPVKRIHISSELRSACSIERRKGSDTVPTWPVRRSLSMARICSVSTLEA